MSLDSSTTTTTAHTTGDVFVGGPEPVKVAPDVIEWIRAQRMVGKTDEALLEEMRGVGWGDALAQQVLALPEASLAVPAVVPQPGPDLRNMPGWIDAGDREVQVLMTMELPRVILFGNVLSRYECAALIAAARERGLQRSKVVANQFVGEHVDPVRTSEGTYFQLGENALLQKIEARLARLLCWPVEQGEGIQVLHYRPGNQYEPHHDYFPLEGSASTPSCLSRGGQRVGTLIMYLADTEAGGGTVFPESRLSIQPCQGNALFFGYDRPDPATRTLHGGAPVMTGEKWIATKWLRERRWG